MEPFEWSQGATDAAQMVADGDVSYEAIAATVGTTQPTLRKRRDAPEFRARVEDLRYRPTWKPSRAGRAIGAPRSEA